MNVGQTNSAEPWGALEATPSAVQDEYAVKVACVYEDEAARNWARGVCGRVPRSAGSGVLGLWEWKLSELSGPETFQEAVEEACKADVILVCVDSREQLPENLFAWVVAWMPRRPQGMGALVAVVRQSDGAGRQSPRAQEYLRSVARVKGMDFIIEEHQLPAESRDPREKGATTPRTCGRTAEVAPTGRSSLN